MYNQRSDKILYIIAIDVFILLLSYLCVSSFYNYDYIKSNFFVLFFSLLIIMIALTIDDYSLIFERDYIKEFFATIKFNLLVLFVFSFVLLLGKHRFITDINHFSYTFIFTILIITTFAIYFSRQIFKNLFYMKTKKPVLLYMASLDNILIQNIVSELYDNDFMVCGIISRDGIKSAKQQIPVLNTIIDIQNFLINKSIEEIIVLKDSVSEFSEWETELVTLGLPLTVEINTTNENIFKYIGDKPFLTTAVVILNFRQVIFKRLIDISVAIFGVIITMLIAVVIFPIIRKESPGPLFFKQQRVGRYGKVFNMYKFRSMHVDAELMKSELLSQNEVSSDLMFKMENDPRVFPFGKKLRQWSLDEFPQFFNVLKGDMSIVGTRPPTLEEYQKYQPHHFKRLAMKPGITGVWQVSGRSNIKDFEEVVAMDLSYLNGWSLSKDIKIIFNTVMVILTKKGSW